MNDKPPAFLAPAVVLLAVSAVLFAGIGGLVSGGTGQKLCAAGAGFCLMMLVVPWVFLSARRLSTGADMGMAVAFGALAGLCYGLCFGAGAGLPGLVGNVALGAGAGLVAYWGRRLRRLSNWRDDSV
ncbi:MAG: hypothetical protein EBR82_09520 [Caulobacteraceae bacterium]|nr:hypothetical protein [Caulobacteraceae bacterium]